MAERLGNLLHWIGCAAALLFIVGGLFAAKSDPDHFGVVFGLMAGFGVLAYLIGRSLRYVLAGR